MFQHVLLPGLQVPRFVPGLGCPVDVTVSPDRPGPFVPVALFSGFLSPVPPSRRNGWTGQSRTPIQTQSLSGSSREGGTICTPLSRSLSCSGLVVPFRVHEVRSIFPPSPSKDVSLGNETVDSPTTTLSRPNPRSTNLLRSFVVTGGREILGRSGSGSRRDEWS